MIEVFGKEVDDSQIDRIDRGSWCSTAMNVEPAVHAAIFFKQTKEYFAADAWDYVGLSPIMFPGRTVEEVKDEVNRLTAKPQVEPQD